MINNMALLRVTENGWHKFDPTSGWQDLEPSPTLDGAAVVVLDFESGVTDVWRFDGKAEYARALIEKRVRTDGLVDGMAHVVVHRLQRFPGGFQAYFSAFPLELWQQVSAWAQAQNDHCLLVHAAALLCTGLPAGQGRMFVSDRDVSVFLNGRSGLQVASVRAVGGDVSRFPALARTLGLQVAASAATLRIDSVAVGLATPGRDVAIHEVMEAFSTASGLHTRWLGAKGAAADDTGQAVLPVLAARAVEAHTLTPGLARMAWKAESWLGRLTVAVAACAVSLMGASVYADAQTQKLTTQVAAVRAEQSALEERMQRVSQVSVEPALLNIADFARKLGDGVRYDPLRLLGDLRRLTPGGIRIQLVKLTPSAQHGKVFLIHGWADVADSSAVVGWVSAMTQAGWRFKAVDPADGAAGTFAYEVVRADAAPGKDRT